MSPAPSEREGSLRDLLLALLAAGALAGCSVGPNYQPPKAALPPSYHEAQSNPAGEPPQEWWVVFQDPELDSLINRALRDNRDLKQAVSRIRQAREERTEVAGAMTPEIDATGGYDRALGSRNVQIPLGALAGSSGGGGSGGGGSGSSSASAPSRENPRAEQVGGASSSPSSAASSAPLGGPNSPFGEGGLPGVTTNLYQAGFDASWEIDIFGGERRAIQAADAEVAAAREGRNAVQVSLMAEVASSYLQLRSAQQRAGIARSNLEAQRKTYAIARDKFRAGLGDESAMEQQAAQVHATEAVIPAWDGTIRGLEHQIAFLLGENPGALVAELNGPGALPPVPPSIPLGVPSELLRRRPDVREAERNLAAATAHVGVATAQLFPQFSITGLFGLDSSDLKHLPEWSSHYYSISPGVSWPLLDWTRLHAAIHVQNELQEQALLSYQTAVVQALKDVEDALVQYENEKTRRVALASAVAAAQKARLVAEQTCSSGLADQLSALSAEGRELQAEDALAQSDGSLRTDVVALYKALGGGWDVTARK